MVGTSSVAADAGSTYEPYPTLKYRWDPKHSAPHNRQYSVQGAQGVDLGPHPADPTAAHIGSQAYDGHLEGPNVLEQRVLGRDIYAYSERGRCVPFVLAWTTPYLVDSWHPAISVIFSTYTYTFWRFLIQIPLTETEMKIQYSINSGLELEFFVPSIRQTMRLAAYSVSE